MGVSGLADDKISALRYLLYPYRADLTSETAEADIVVSDQLPVATSKPLVKLSAHNEVDTYPKSYGNGIVELPSDLIENCSERLKRVMNPRTSPIYRLVTHLPFRYSVFPSWIRNMVLRIHRSDVSVPSHLANEMTRRTLLEAFHLAGFELARKNLPRLVITHDVESENGLKKALSMKAVDDELGVESVWFLTSSEYQIPKQVAKELGEGSVIGSHDVRHDGKLIQVRRNEQLVQRLLDSKIALEALFGREITCFRSPLLQFSKRIAIALGKAGYEYDFSLPCWEPVHPSSMDGFGIESVQAFEVDGVVELPLTLFQDHQVLSMLGLSTREAIKFWISQADMVQALSGDIVLLVHPDYAFSEDLSRYKALLFSLKQIHDRSILDPTSDLGSAQFA